MTHDIDPVPEVMAADLPRLGEKLGADYFFDEDTARTAVRHQTMIWIVSAEDLLLSKLDWLKDSRSEMQFADVRNLIGAVPTLDWNYLQHWANTLGIRHLLDEVRS